MRFQIYPYKCGGKHFMRRFQIYPALKISLMNLFPFKNEITEIKTKTTTTTKINFCARHTGQFSFMLTPLLYKYINLYVYFTLFVKLRKVQFNF